MTAWPTVELGELMVKRAGSVDPSKHPDEVFDLYSIPAFDAGAPEIVSGSGIGSSKQIVSAGDLLLSRIVPHIRRAWVVGSDQGRRLIASGEWMVFRSDRIHADWLRHVLTGDVFHAQLMQTVAGVGGSLMRARPAHVATIAIPLPPLPEQRRIAAILDHADTLRAKRREALAQLEELTQSIFIDMFGDAGSKDTLFRTVNIGEIALQVTDGEHQTPKRESEGVLLLSARNVHHGRLDLGTVDHIGTSEYERIRKRCDPKVGDILISCSGSIGRVAVVPEMEPFSLVRSVALVRFPPDQLLPNFVMHYLRTPQLQRMMQQRANSSAQANLFQGPIRELPIVVPPIGLQKSFELKAAQIDVLKRQQQSALGAFDDLFASLQHRAFRGEL
ncbi:restriction endonuclease subunit S [Rhodococcus qingshengii]